MKDGFQQYIVWIKSFVLFLICIVWYTDEKFINPEFFDKK